VAEVDESDGSIAGYDPRIGVILNVSEDHKPMAELENLFGGYADRSERVVLGIDSDPVALIARAMPSGKAVTFSLLGDADFSVRELETHEGGCRSLVSTRSGEVTLDLPLIGAFNIGNALAAMAAADLMGVSAEESAEHLRAFRGTARRLERVGSKGGITVIDDFAHNPEKIAASIGALTRHYAGLHILYQPHGYGPLRSFRPLYEKAFAEVLRPHDRLTLTEPVYFGGTVTKSDDAELLAKTLKQAGFKAQYVTHRDDFRRETKSFTEGDAVVVMGARDDGLTIFARELLGELT
jgi:UDP-N-acetylmuramate--alanine ligase